MGTSHFIFSATATRSSDRPSDSKLLLSDDDDDNDERDSCWLRRQHESFTNATDRGAGDEARIPCDDDDECRDDVKASGVVVRAVTAAIDASQMAAADAVDPEYRTAFIVNGEWS